MIEKIEPYFEFAKKNDNSLKKLRQTEKFKPVSKTDVFRDLNLSLSAFQGTIESIKSCTSEVNPAALYDFTLSIRDFSESLDAPVTRQIFNSANETLASAGKQLTLNDANSRLFDYYSVLSDMKFVSETMSETCQEISRSPKGALTDLSAFADTLENSVDGILSKIGNFLGSVGESLKNAFKNLAKFLKNNVIDKLKEAFNKAAEALDKLKLMMLQSMFRFVGKVADLAKENGWNVKEIKVEMPEIGVKLEKLQIASISTPIPIPMPQITPPKVSMTFIP